MRKKVCSVLLVLILLLSTLGPGIVIAKPAQQSEMEKISVSRTGKLTDSSGKDLDWRLFIYTTYDNKGKLRMKKGRARYRKPVMYLDKSLLSQKVDDKELRSYLRAEQKSGRTSAKARPGQRKNRQKRPVTSSSSAASAEIAKLRKQLTDKQAEFDQVNRDNQALRAENQRLRDENTQLKTQVIPQPSPTPPPAKPAVYVGQAWQPAWWNFYGRYEWWPSWFISSSGLDWNYVPLSIVWLAIAALLIFIVRTLWGKKKSQRSPLKPTFISRTITLVRNLNFRRGQKKPPSVIQTETDQEESGKKVYNLRKEGEQVAGEPGDVASEVTQVGVRKSTSRKPGAAETSSSAPQG